MSNNRTNFLAFIDGVANGFFLMLLYFGSMISLLEFDKGIPWHYYPTWRIASGLTLFVILMIGYFLVFFFSYMAKGETFSASKAVCSQLNELRGIRVNGRGAYIGAKILFVFALGPQLMEMVNQIIQFTGDLRTDYPMGVLAVGMSVLMGINEVRVNSGQTRLDVSRMVRKDWIAFLAVTLLVALMTVITRKADISNWLELLIMVGGLTLIMSVYYPYTLRRQRENQLSQ